MNHINVVCPHCKKELQLPADAENIICMYCATPIDVKSLIDEKMKTDSEDYDRLLGEAEALLSDEVFNYKIKLRDFKKDIYPKQFEYYLGVFSKSLKQYSLAASIDNKATEYFAGLLFDRFQNQLEIEGIKKENDSRFFDYRYMIVLFTVPAIMEQKTPYAEALADSFLNKWNTKYPKSPLGKSNFDSINSGFRKKACFITTATCTSLGKGDNCEELNAFRKFRDEWFSKTEYGKEKITEYYIFAPMIVSAIEKSKNKSLVYKQIWGNQLLPCLKLLKAGKFKMCAEQYENMILNLEKEWLQ